MAMVRRRGHGHGPTARAKGPILLICGTWGYETKTKSILSPSFAGVGVNVYMGNLYQWQRVCLSRAES